MKLKLNLCLITIAFCFTFSAVKAQTTTVEFTPGHLQAAENFLIATGINVQFGVITSNLINTMSNQVPENSRTAFIVVFKKFMDKYFTWDLLKGDLSKLYATEFTEDELKQLADFYNTPTGKKYGAKMATLSQKGMQLGQQLMVSHQAELQQMMQDASKTN